MCMIPSGREYNVDYVNIDDGVYTGDYIEIYEGSSDRNKALVKKPTCGEGINGNVPTYIQVSTNTMLIR